MVNIQGVHDLMLHLVLHTVHSGAALGHLTKISTFFIVNQHCISKRVHLAGHFAF